MRQTDFSTHPVLSPIVKAVEKELNHRKCDMGWEKPVILAIDGCCGSGKTTCAQAICRYFGASCIHCDDFFLPSHMRTKERLDEIGGNVHYERLAEVLHKVRQGKPFTYQAYDCSSDSFVDKTFTPTEVVVVEGSYALHRALQQFYDVKVVLTVDKQTQYNRLLQRESVHGVENFVNKWIPLENMYFDNLDTTDCFVIKTDSYEKH